MAKKIIPSRTIVDPSKYSGSLFDLVDEKVEKEKAAKQPDIFTKQAQNALFENNHKTDKLNKVYETLDAKQLQKTTSISDQAYDDLNPFYGDKDALTTLQKRPHFNDIVAAPDQPTPTLEIKQAPAEKAKPVSTRRKRLWWITGTCCAVLFAVLFTFNMVNISSLIDSSHQTQLEIAQQQEELQSALSAYEQQMSESGITETAITEGMTPGSGGVEVDLSPGKVSPTYQAPTSFWDQLCNFFAKLFGR